MKTLGSYVRRALMRAKGGKGRSMKAVKGPGVRAFNKAQPPKRKG
jgi:hypothetical protein